MMKSILVLLMALFIAACPFALAEEAAPQTRQEVIILEGMEEEITTTYFESERGYSMWIDEECVRLLPEDEGGDMDVFVNADPEAVDVRLAISYYAPPGYTFEGALRDVEGTLNDNYGGCDVVDGEVFSDYRYRWYAAQTDEMIDYRFVVDAGEGAFYIALQYPWEAAEGFGSRIAQMLGSFEIRDMSVE